MSITARCAQSWSSSPHDSRGTERNPIWRALNREYSALPLSARGRLTLGAARVRVPRGEAARFRAARESFWGLAGKGDVPCLTSPTAEQRRQAHCCSAVGLAGQADMGGGDTSGGPRCRCRGKDPSWGAGEVCLAPVRMAGAIRGAAGGWWGVRRGLRRGSGRWRGYCWGRRESVGRSPVAGGL